MVVVEEEGLVRSKKFDRREFVLASINIFKVAIASREV